MSTLSHREQRWMRVAHQMLGGLVLYVCWSWYGWGALGLAMLYGVVSGVAHEFRDDA